MIKLFRKDAIQILSYIQLLRNYDSVQREAVLSEMYSEEDECDNIDFDDAKNNSSIILFINSTYIGVKNDYLIAEIFEMLNVIVIIPDAEDLSLERCPCCEYKIIKDRGHYEICSICFWEDDGSDELERYSPPNHLSLKEAKINFLNLGVISEKFIKFINNKLKSKYHL